MDPNKVCPSEITFAIHFSVENFVSLIIQKLWSRLVEMAHLEFVVFFLKCDWFTLFKWLGNSNSL